MALPCGGSLATKSAIPRALGARGSLLRVAQGAVAGKEGKETSGLVSGNRRGFMHKPRGLLIQPPREDACPLPHWSCRHPEYPLQQPTDRPRAPGSSAALHVEWRQGPSPPYRPTGAECLGPGAWPRACPHPVPLPGSQFSRPRFHLLAWRLHRTLLAHRVGPSADEVPGVLLRHKMRLSLVSPPIFSWQLVFVLKYLSFHVSRMNPSQSQLCGLAGSWLSPQSHGFTQPAVAPAHLPEEGSTPQTACRLCGDVLPAAATPGSDLFLALPGYGCASCVTAQAPRVSLCRL